MDTRCNTESGLQLLQPYQSRPGPGGKLKIGKCKQASKLPPHLKKRQTERKSHGRRDCGPAGPARVKRQISMDELVVIFTVDGGNDAVTVIVLTAPTHDRELAIHLPAKEETYILETFLS